MRACSAPRADQEADNGKGTGGRCSSPGIAPSWQTLTVAEPRAPSTATEFVTPSSYNSPTQDDEGSTR